MTPYEKSKEFIRLEKIAELEKIILGNIEDAKDGNDGEIIPESVRSSLRDRGASPIPKEVLDKTIDDGLEDTASLLHKHKAMLLPGEALYHAIGKKDNDIYNAATSMRISDILSMITNMPAVSQTRSCKHMDLDDFDEPRHIRIIVKMRGMSPSILSKTAREKINLGNMDTMDAIQLTYVNGRKEKVGPKYAKEHKAIIEQLINDGVIIKAIKILSGGIKVDVLNKTASSDDIYDKMYIEMIKGSLNS